MRLSESWGHARTGGRRRGEGDETTAECGQADECGRGRRRGGLMGVNTCRSVTVKEGGGGKKEEEEWNDARDNTGTTSLPGSVSAVSCPLLPTSATARADVVTAPSKRHPVSSERSGRLQWNVRCHAMKMTRTTRVKWWTNSARLCGPRRPPQIVLYSMTTSALLRSAEVRHACCCHSPMSSVSLQSPT